MAVGYLHRHPFDEHKSAYLRAVAEQGSIALERAQAAEEGAARQEQRVLLAEASLALTNRYASPGQLLDTPARLAVPRLGDWCSVILERGGNLERVAQAYALPPLHEEARELISQLGVHRQDGASAKVFAEGVPVILAGEGQPPFDPAAYGSIAKALGVTPAMLLP
ncbi:MAG: hypothetical protein ACYDC0_14965 [Acidimicrobiales bacterium]